MISGAAHSPVAEVSNANRFLAMVLITIFFYCSPSKAQVADSMVWLWRNGVTLLSEGCK